MGFAWGSWLQWPVVFILEGQVFKLEGVIYSLLCWRCDYCTKMGYFCIDCIPRFLDSEQHKTSSKPDK